MKRIYTMGELPHVYMNGKAPENAQAGKYAAVIGDGLFYEYHKRDRGAGDKLAAAVIRGLNEPAFLILSVSPNGNNGQWYTGALQKAVPAGIKHVTSRASCQYRAPDWAARKQLTVETWHAEIYRLAESDILTRAESFTRYRDRKPSALSEICRLFDELAELERLDWADKAAHARAQDNTRALRIKYGVIENRFDLALAAHEYERQNANHNAENALEKIRHFANASAAAVTPPEKTGRPIDQMKARRDYWRQVGQAYQERARGRCELTEAIRTVYRSDMPAGFYAAHVANALASVGQDYAAEIAQAEKRENWYKTALLLHGELPVSYGRGSGRADLVPYMRAAGEYRGAWRHAAENRERGLRAALEYLDRVKTLLAQAASFDTLPNTYRGIFDGANNKYFKMPEAAAMRAAAMPPEQYEVEREKRQEEKRAQENERRARESLADAETSLAAGRPRSAAADLSQANAYANRLPECPADIRQAITDTDRRIAAATQVISPAQEYLNGGAVPQNSGDYARLSGDTFVTSRQARVSKREAQKFIALAADRIDGGPVPAVSVSVGDFTYSPAQSSDEYLVISCHKFSREALQAVQSQLT